MIHLLPVHVQYISMQKGERRCWTLAIHTRGGETGKESGVGKGGKCITVWRINFEQEYEKKEREPPPHPNNRWANLNPLEKEMVAHSSILA